MQRRRRRCPFAPWILVLLITSGRSTVHHPSTLIDPGRFPNWKVDARPHLCSIYYSTFLFAGCVNACATCVTHVRVAEVHLILVRFGEKGGWKIAGNFGNAFTLPIPSSSRLHLIKGARSSSGLRKNFQPLRTYIHIYTQTRCVRIHVLSWRSLATRYADKLHYAARGYRPVSVSPAGARTRVKHWITRRWRSLYFIRYRFRRVLICTSQNLSTILLYSLYFNSSQHVKNQMFLCHTEM